VKHLQKTVSIVTRKKRYRVDNIQNRYTKRKNKVRAGV